METADAGRWPLPRVERHILLRLAYSSSSAYASSSGFSSIVWVAVFFPGAVIVHHVYQPPFLLPVVCRFVLCLLFALHPPVYGLTVLVVVFIDPLRRRALSQSAKIFVV